MASRLAQTIQNYLAVVGIRAKLVQRDAAAMREAAWKGETDLVLKDWWADYPDAENFLYPLLHGANMGSGGNVSFWQSWPFDDLVNRARRERRDEARAQLYRRADSVAYAAAPMLYLFHASELYAVQPWLQGFEAPVIFNGQRWMNAVIGDAAIVDEYAPAAAEAGDSIPLAPPVSPIAAPAVTEPSRPDSLAPPRPDTTVTPATTVPPPPAGTDTTRPPPPPPASADTGAARPPGTPPPPDTGIGRPPTTPPPDTGVARPPTTTPPPRR
jgi:hypothetical protein